MGKIVTFLGVFDAYGIDWPYDWGNRIFRRKHPSLGLLAYKGYLGFGLQHSEIVGIQLVVTDRYLVEEIGSFD